MVGVAFCVLASGNSGVYVCRDDNPGSFQRVKAPAKSALEELVQLIIQRVGRCLERQGLLEQYTESYWLDLSIGQINGLLRVDFLTDTAD